ncbi:MAG: TROVE domain-containing protein [Tannerella sp.]|jgi:hypothetical protein|nr:TROVE domain-containing protein [Tannerella sp.]
MNVSTAEEYKTTNYEGAPAYRLSHRWHLYSIVVTSALNDKFYETLDNRIETIRELIKQTSPQYVSRLAVYAREQMNLRSIPLVLAVELSGVHSGDSLVGRLTSRIIQRADEITELLAYYQQSYGHKTSKKQSKRTAVKKLNRLSKQLQHGLKEAFNKFDEYQFAKYNHDAEVKLRDALFLVHPAPKDENQQILFNKIAGNKLETPYTWETELSALGQKKFAFEQDKTAAFGNKWAELIDSEKLGYMALLRNLRNILKNCISSKHIRKVCETLASEERILKSKLLPFRFFAAYRELSKADLSGGTWQIMEALEKAVTISVRNIAGFDESTNVLIACDVSGSMQHPVSMRGKIQNYETGLMLGMLLKSRCRNVVTGIFGDKWKIINLPDSGILSNVDTLRKYMDKAGYSTNGYLVLQDLIDRRQVMDKIMIFSDCQLWDSSGHKISMRQMWQTYKTIAPNARLYLFDLAGYGTTPLNIAANDVYLIAGWSDKIFDMLDAIENGEDIMTKIDKIEL